MDSVQPLIPALCTRIVTSSLPYSIIHPPSGLKNKSNNGASAELVTFPFSPSISSSQWNSFFFLTLFYPYFSSKIISPPLLLPQFNAGCFLSLPTLSLFRPPPPLPPPQSGTNSQDPVTYLMQRRSCSIDTIKLSVLVQKWCIFGYFFYNLCLI